MSYFIEKKAELSPIHVTIDSSSDELDSGDCKLIRHQSKKYDYADEDDGYDYDYFQPIKNRNAQSKLLKQFLFVIGFALTLTILSQLLLTFYHEDPSGIIVQSNIYLYAFVAIEFRYSFYSDSTRLGSEQNKKNTNLCVTKYQYNLVRANIIM